MTDNRTTELREKLAERGIEYTTDDGEHVKSTCWSYMGELMAEFAEFDNGTTRFACDNWCFTPDQAIVATLRGGMCHITASSTDGLCSDNPRQYFELSCGHTFTLDGLEPPNYCPNCGAKIIQGVDDAD